MAKKMKSTTATVFLFGAVISALAAVQAMKPNSKLRLRPSYVINPDDRLETPPPRYPCTPYPPPPPPPPPPSSDCCSKEYVEGVVCALNVQRALRDLEPLTPSYELTQAASRWVASPETHDRGFPWMDRRERRFAQTFWTLRRLAPCYGPLQTKPSNMVGFFYQKCTNFRPNIADQSGQFYQVSEQSWNYTRQVGVGCSTWQMANGDQMLLVNVWFDHPDVAKNMEADNEEIAKQIEADKSLAEEEKPEVEVPQVEESGKNEEGKDEKPAEEKSEEKEEEKEEEEKDEKEDE
ncbi:hypothetical protein TYRP_022390 [Tyrophagus putrescentiae]|nr:hypothetical protein TYRP_022390 [Tyrophagus putrescentiae]